MVTFNRTVFNYAYVADDGSGWVVKLTQAQGDAGNFKSDPGGLKPWGKISKANRLRRVQGLGTTFGDVVWLNVGDPDTYQHIINTQSFAKARGDEIQEYQLIKAEGEYRTPVVLPPS